MALESDGLQSSNLCIELRFHRTWKMLECSVSSCNHVQSSWYVLSADAYSLYAHATPCYWTSEYWPVNKQSTVTESDEYKYCQNTQDQLYTIWNNFSGELQFTYWGFSFTKFMKLELNSRYIEIFQKFLILKHFLNWKPVKILSPFKDPNFDGNQVAVEIGISKNTQSGICAQLDMIVRTVYNRKADKIPSCATELIWMPELTFST